MKTDYENMFGRGQAHVWSSVISSFGQYIMYYLVHLNLSRTIIKHLLIDSPTAHLRHSTNRQTAPNVAVKILLYHTENLKMLLIFLTFLKGVTFRRAEALLRTISECQVKARWIRVIFPYGCFLILPSEVNTGPGEATHLSETPL